MMTDIPISRHHRFYDPARRDHARLPSARFARANPSLIPQQTSTKRTQEPSSSDIPIICAIPHPRPGALPSSARREREPDPLSRAEWVGKGRGEGARTNLGAAGPAWVNDLYQRPEVLTCCRARSLVAPAAVGRWLDADTGGRG